MKTIKVLALDLEGTLISWKEALLVDDYEVFVHPGQEDHYVKVDTFAPPFSDHDKELTRVLKVLLHNIRK